MSDIDELVAKYKAEIEVKKYVYKVKPDNVIFKIMEFGNAQAGLNVCDEKYVTYCKTLDLGIEVLYGYFKYSNIGRMHLKTSLNSHVCSVTINKELRAVLFQGCYEIDIVSCQPTIFLQLLQRYEIPCPMLELYVEDRSLFDKEKVLKIMFGMSIDKLGEVDDLTKSLYYEFRTNVEKYVEIDKVFYDECLRDLIISNLLKNEDGYLYNTKMKVFSRMLQTYEARCIISIVKYLLSIDVVVRSIIYDAVIVDKLVDVTKLWKVVDFNLKYRITQYDILDMEIKTFDEYEVRLFMDCDQYKLVEWLISLNLKNIVSSIADGAFFTYDSNRRIWVDVNEHSIFEIETVTVLIRNKFLSIMENAERNILLMKLIDSRVVGKMNSFYKRPSLYTQVSSLYIKNYHKQMEKIYFNNIKDVIPFQDKVINLMTKEIRLREYTDYFTFTIDRCLLTLDENDVIFNDIKLLVKNASRKDGIDREDLEEFHHINLGSCLVGSCSSNPHSGVVSYLKGDGNDGKSVLYFNLLNACLTFPLLQQTYVFTTGDSGGANSHSANVLSLKYARCTISNEPSVKVIGASMKKFVEFNTTNFLNASDCNNIGGREFGSKKMTSFNFQAKIVIISNYGPREIPNHIDKRLMFVPFNTRFPTKEENHEEYDKNRTFCDSIMFKPDVIFSYLVIGAIKYTEGKLKIDLPCILEAKQDIKMSVIENEETKLVNSLYSFVNDRKVIYTDETYESVTSIYEHYVEYCLKNGLQKLYAKNKFSTALISYFNDVNPRTQIYVMHTDKFNCINVQLVRI